MIWIRKRPMYFLTNKYFKKTAMQKGRIVQLEIKEKFIKKKKILFNLKETSKESLLKWNGYLGLSNYGKECY